MFEFINAYDINTFEWILIAICGILVGISKTGISGAGLAVVPILATIFGGKPSTGLLLPMLIMADIFAVKYYNRHAEWHHVFKLLPWAFIGIIIALIIGNIITTKLFNNIIAITVMTGIIMMIWRDIKGEKTKIPENLWFTILLGITGGFATMIGNAAGPIMALYLLSMRLPKNNFIGTAAWFFFIINVSKVPLHIFFWRTISLKTFYFDLVVLPSILLGVILGIAIVKKIPEKLYRIIVIATTIISAIILFFK